MNKDDIQQQPFQNQSKNDQDIVWERRADSHLRLFKDLLEMHTLREMEKHDQIIAKINANDEKSNNRHDVTQEKIRQLTSSVEEWMNSNSEFIESIKRAFPRDNETGKPDYDGHRAAHLALIEDNNSSKELKNYIKKVVLGASAVAICSFIAIATWATFLKGPM
jgi:hypothetical protein